MPLLRLYLRVIGLLAPEKGLALHTAYWHDQFGTRRSHGCVNLSPKDARWLYGFTSPAVPDGWVAVHPTDNDRGTFVRVRDSAG